MHSAKRRMPPAISLDRLRVASHVRACSCGRSVILLDLRRSRYLGVSETVSKALAGHVDGWPLNNEPGSADAWRDANFGVAQSLVSQGLLTPEPADRTPVITLQAATASIDIDAPLASRFLGARRLLQFTGSVAVAAWWLRCRSLEAAANSITARRSQLPSTQAESLALMRPGMLAYEALRPFAFTAREKCLLDSLALVTFLARDGLLPRWVIGVKTSPFGAHSWVQSGTTVLNDQHEYVRQFSPILVV